MPPRLTARSSGNDIGQQESGALRRRLKEIRDAAHPQSRRVGQLRTEVKRAVEKDNVEKLLGYGSSALAGVDRYGKDLTTPADSTVKGWRLRLGRVLAPEGLASRAITRFKVKWIFDGSQWRMVAGWVGIPWMIYHLKGARKGSKGIDRLGRDMSNWHLPRRDIGGISPKGWVEVRAAFKRFTDYLHRKQSRGG